MKSRIDFIQKDAEAEVKKRIVELKRWVEKYLEKYQMSAAALLVYTNGELLAEICFGIAVGNPTAKKIVAHIKEELDDEIFLIEARMPIIEYQSNLAVLIAPTLNFDYSIFFLLLGLNQDNNERNCPECGGRANQPHRFGCMAEICPRCGERLSKCGCPDRIDLPADDWMRTREGAIPKDGSRILTGQRQKIPFHLKY